MAGKRIAGAVAIATAAITLGATACGSSSGGSSSSGGLPSTITIGSPLDLSGPAAAAAVGVSELKGEQLAVSEINSKGFLGKSKIDLSYTDTQTQTNQAVQAVIGMTKANKVDAIIGFTLSASFLAAGHYAQAAQVPVITVDLSDTGITQVGSYIFRVAPAENDVYKATDPQILKSLGAKTAAYIYDSDSANVQAQSTYRRQLAESLGVKTVADESVTSDAISFQAQLTKIKDAHPDVLVQDLNGGQDPTFLAQAAQAGLKIPIMADIGFDTPSIFTTPEANCATFSTIWDASSTTGQNQQFQAAFMAKYKTTPDVYAAEGFDAVWLMATAMKNSNSATGPKVRAALAAIKDYSGALGVYGFNAQRSPTITPLTFEIDNGKAIPWKPGTTCTP
jgi:branched-chain amino acid transport system substrate-binding protein